MILDYSPLIISLKIAFLATLLAFIIGTFTAFLMYFYQGKTKGVIDGILTLPLVLPPTVLGFLLLFIFSKNSFIGQVLAQLEISIVFSWWAGVITGTLVAFPLMYKITIAAFEQVEIELIYIAQTLGANQQKILWQILLPLAWRGILAGIILSFARVLGEFGATFMVAGNIPRQTQTMAMAIFVEASAGKMDIALKWVIIMVAIALFIITLVNYYSSSTITTQSKWAKLVGYWLINHQYSEYQVTINLEKKITFKLQKTLSEFDLNILGQIGDNPLGLLGASGTGKSMFLKCIAGIETPDKGQIILNGRTLFDSEKNINLPCDQRKIGIV